MILIRKIALRLWLSLCVDAQGQIFEKFKVFPTNDIKKDLFPGCIA